MNRIHSARRRAQQMRRSAGSRRSAGGESRAALRLVICGVVFVLLVAVKLLFPEAVGGIARSAGRLIGRDADFKEAFAAMGRAISGEAAVSDSLQDAYTAVFNPSSPAASPPAAVPSGTSVPLDPGARLIRYTAPTLPEMTAQPVHTEVVVDTVSRQPVPAAGEDAGTAADPPEDPTPAAPPSGEPEPEDEAVTHALSYVYTMPALPDNASLEQRNLGFSHCTPVHGPLSSPFGWREHPVEGGGRFHYGVDLAAEEGTDVVAFADGTVYATGESSTLGNYIMLQHQGGYITLYAHCSRVTVSGGPVAQGEKIAEVGSTGLVTGPHLHFELHDGDLYLNPIYYVEIG